MDLRMSREEVITRLNKAGVLYEYYEHEQAHTIEDCLKMPFITDDITICKNILLCNRQQTDFYLLMLPGDKPFKTSVLSKQIGSSRLSFAGGEYMEQFLDITPGSLSVLGLMNDKENRVRLLIDKELLSDQWIGCHPCINTSTLRLKTADLIEKIIPAMTHSITYVELSREEI